MILNKGFPAQRETGPCLGVLTPDHPPQGVGLGLYGLEDQLVDGHGKQGLVPGPLSIDLHSSVATLEGGPLKLATMGQMLLPSLDRACLCARVASDNKARDIVVLDLRKITPLYDFFVLATGTSRRQIHTITEEIDATLRRCGDRRLSVEGYESSTWVVQDYGDIMVHVFNPQTREYYALEELWADAPRIDWEQHCPSVDEVSG